MSKALSANIHDPNHTADEYDLYFNGLYIFFKFYSADSYMSESDYPI